MTIQFASSMVLIIGTFTVYEQLQFMLNSPKGVDTSQTLVINGPNTIDSAYISKFRNFFTVIEQHAGVEKITVSSDVPGQRVRNSNGNVHLVGQDVKTGNMFQAIMTDENFIDIYGLKLLAGKNFSGELEDQWKSVIVNETAMKLLGFTDPDKLIGRRMYLWDSEPEIVGVMRDYHQEYLKQKIKPLALVYDQEITNSVYYSIKINDQKSIKEVVSLAEREYGKFFPGNAISYFFLNNHYDQQYRYDRQFGKIVGLFTLLAILIACLGLFGLSSYIILQRMKEISIRKVLGASVVQIASLTSKEFIFVVLIASLVSCPLAFYLINSWLNNFAFRIEVSEWLFVIPISGVLIIAVLTVCSQSIKAALLNPVDNLKND